MVLASFPNKDKNMRYPHIGAVIIEDNCEIGCGSTIDRGSMSNTVIGENTYLDNQIHIAHNVKIGKNSIISRAGWNCWKFNILVKMLKLEVRQVYLDI